MRRKLLIHLGLAIGLVGLAIGFDWWSKSINPVGRYAQDIGDYLRVQEKNAAQWLTDQQVFLKTQIANAPKLGDAAETHSANLEAIAAEPFTICFVKGDSLVFWTNNRAIPDAKTFARWQRGPFQPSIQKLPSGHYEVLRQPFDNLTAYTLIPVKFAFASSDFVGNQAFPSSSNVPQGLDLSENPTDFAIKSKDGSAIGFLKTSSAIDYRPFLTIKFWLYLAALIAFFIFINTASRILAEKYQAATGAMLLIPVVGSIIYLNQKLDFTRRFEGMDLFARTFKAPFLSNSIGDMLINIGILLWLMIFFHRHFRVRGYRNLPILMRFAVSVGNYMSVVVSILISAWIFRELVFSSNISFDFSNVFNLDVYSVMAIVGVIFLLMAMFLFSHRMVISVFSADLSRKQRTLASVVAVAVSAPMMWKFQFDLDMDPWTMIAFSLIYAMAFDYFVAEENNKMTWAVAWLLVFSCFTTILLFKYNDTKDVNSRLAYAAIIANDRDSLAEVQLDEFRNDLRGSADFPMLFSPYRFKTGHDSLRLFLNQKFYPKRYLFQHYSYEIAAFDSDKIAAVDPQAVPTKDSMEAVWARSKPAMGDDLRILKDAKGSSSYLMRVPVAPQRDSAHPLDLYLLIKRERRTPTNVFSHLFFNQPYKNLVLLPRYQYAIYKNKERKEEVGKLSDYTMQTDSFPKNPGGHKRYRQRSDDRDVLFYRSPDTETETVVILSRKTGGLLKRMYLFSSIFATLSVFMILLAGINSFAHFLPEGFQFYLTPKGSLSRRIQFWMGTVIISSFAIIGYLTYTNFENASRENIKEQLNKSTSAMISQIEQNAEKWNTPGNQTTQSLQLSIDSLAKIHSIDVNLYNVDGKLIYTSQPELRQLGAVSPIMSSRALFALKNQRLSEKIDEEHTGSFEYSTDYLPLLGKDQKAAAFIGVPYYLKGSGIRTDVSDFIGKLLTLYVFLLLAAAIIATEVSKSIAKPIKELGERMESMKLEEKNESVYIKGQDDLEELRSLVGEFNRMIDKIEESKGLLARSEREGAWRKMARQVAHEIRNPLTTMKLSMQQLERSVAIDPDNFEHNLRKTSNRLITQIDDLAEIAGDFYLYAEINNPPKNDVLLNDVVESVFDLFGGHDNADISLDQQPEGRKYHVLGGNSHLGRVFKNLILNGIQAVPHGERGKIDVSIYEKEGFVVVKVADNGGGVPAEIRDKIFEPNFTTKSSGTGLGLPICKSIIDALDGKMYFEVRENEGTDFYIELPIQYVENELETFAAR